MEAVIVVCLIVVLLCTLGSILISDDA